MKRLIPLAFVLFWVAACSAAQKGGILDVRGPCGGDGLETECPAAHRCCAGWEVCTAAGCWTRQVGPKPDVPQ